MFTIIRLAFLGFLCAYLLSYSPLSGADLPLPDGTLGAQSESIVPDLEEDTITDLMGTVQNFCSDQPKVCEMRDAALRMAHVQAVSLTGALHDWLAESLDEG